MKYNEYFKKMVLPYVKDDDELQGAAYAWGEAAWDRAMLESTRDPHELWAAAQLMPGEGIYDGVRRVKELLGGDVEMAKQAWKSYNKLKAEGKIPADFDRGTTSSGAKVRHRTGQQWREYER